MGGGTVPVYPAQRKQETPAAVSFRFSQYEAEDNSAQRQAELFYLQKQIQSQTPMVIVLEDGERVEGCIEWYDRSALKLRGRAKTLIYKSAIKYMYKLGEAGTVALAHCSRKAALRKRSRIASPSPKAGGNGTQNDGACLCIKRPQAGVEAARQLHGRVPSAPTKTLWRHAMGHSQFGVGQFGGKHDAEAFVLVWLSQLQGSLPGSSARVRVNKDQACSRGIVAET